MNRPVIAIPVRTKVRVLFPGCLSAVGNSAFGLRPGGPAQERESAAKDSIDGRKVDEFLEQLQKPVAV